MNWLLTKASPSERCSWGHLPSFWPTAKKSIEVVKRKYKIFSWPGQVHFFYINLHISVTHRYPVFDTSRQNIWIWPPPYLCYEKSHLERDSVGQRIEDGLRLLMDDRSCQRWRRRRRRVKYLGGNSPRLTWSSNSEGEPWNRICLKVGN